MELYHPHILQHSNSPVGFEEMKDATHVVEAYNPICGDQFEVYLKIKNAEIVDISFKGYGCAVSKASTSMLVEQLKGAKLEEGLNAIKAFLEKMGRNDPEDSSLSVVTESESSTDVLLVAKKYAGREKCATLSWEALAQHLII